MNAKFLKQGGSIYDTLYVAQVSKGPNEQSILRAPSQGSVYDASKARFSNVASTHKIIDPTNCSFPIEE